MYRHRGCVLQLGLSTWSPWTAAGARVCWSLQAHCWRSTAACSKSSGSLCGMWIPKEGAVHDGDLAVFARVATWPSAQTRVCCWLLLCLLRTEQRLAAAAARHLAQVQWRCASCDCLASRLARLSEAQAAVCAWRVACSHVCVCKACVTDGLMMCLKHSRLGLTRGHTMVWTASNTFRLCPCSPSLLPTTEASLLRSTTCRSIQDLGVAPGRRGCHVA